MPDKQLESWPGRAYPLGATFDGVGTHFAVYSGLGTEVQLCVFDDQQREQAVPMIERNAFVWHAYLPGVLPGQRYGYRVVGPSDFEQGLRCHSSKLLLDPYVYAIEGEVEWDEALYGYNHDDPEGPPNEEDSAPFMPKGVVINPFFEWGDDYELHVKGFTARHRGVPERLRGTYAGLGHPAAIESLKAVGITAVELLPVHQFVHDAHLVERGLRNYWGYNSIGFFAPHNGYSASGQRGQQVAEFKAMVQHLHRAGTEVIVDVVYNHTAEGGKYRDCVRDFWRAENETLPEFANRIRGNSDLYQDDGRRPSSSINFVTAHDGFTLRDLVSYNEKHNEGNGEDNADGESHRSWNCGVEGETDDPDILALRARQQRNMLTTLLLSQGVPMLLAGDELGRTQMGNNNAYCQDNETSRLDWPASDDKLREFVSRLIGLRRRHATFRRTNWFAGHPVGRPRSGRPLPDIAWFTQEGKGR